MSARAQATAATRRRLLAAAWEHFGTQPYEEVRLSEIAAAAAVTVQTLHASFGTKEQLLTAAYIWWGEQVIAGRDLAPVGRVAGAIANLFEHYETHGSAVLRMLSQEERFPAVKQMTDVGRFYHREWAARIFQPLLSGLRGRARERRLAAIVVATDLLVWKLLRLDMALDREEAERIMVDTVQAVASAA
jgi:AcrR family transcriptional regulator